MTVTWDRALLVEVLVYHYRKTDSISSGCGCGWAELGRSHPEHVAQVYEESVRARHAESAGAGGAWVVEFDYRSDDGPPHVGPFDSKEQASAWLDEQSGFDFECGLVQMVRP